jgi:hypothetical protein
MDMALHLVARLTDVETIRKVQLDIEYDSQPPFEGVDLERMTALPRSVRAGVNVVAPLVTSSRKRMRREAGSTSVI